MAEGADRKAGGVGKLGEKSVRWFADHFMHACDAHSSTRFCFVLGAGASVSSGIPTAGQLAWEWAAELAPRLRLADAQAVVEKEKWNADNLGANYFDVYDLRFDYDPREGLRAIDSATSRAEGPSIGYGFLARVLAETRHNLAITVNFDNLIADAVFLYTGEYPRLCSHESLANFVRPMDDKPVIAKLHRDRALAPMSKKDETDELHGAWKCSLDELFKYYTPVFLGYGANDQSLMGYLNEFAGNGGRFPSSPVWFVYAETDDALPERDIAPLRQFIDQNHGILIRHAGFDYVMNELGGALGWQIDELDRRLEAKFKKQRGLLATFLVKSAENASGKGKDAPDLSRDAASSFEKVVEKGSISEYILRARTLSPENSIDIYNEAIYEFPQDCDLYLGRASVHLCLGNFDDAIADLVKARELDPDWETISLALGRALCLAGHVQESISIFSELLEEIPYCGEIHAHRGIAYIKLQKYSEAFDDYVQAQHSSLGGSKLDYEFAKAFAEVNDSALATHYLMRASKRSPDFYRKARTDQAFDTIRHDPEFVELIGGE